MWCLWPNPCTAPLLLLTHYTSHLPWTVTIHNIPTLPYRLQCLNTPEYEGRKLLWKVVTLCQLTWHHIPEDFNLHWYHHENLKSCFVKKLYLSLCIKPRQKSHRSCTRDLHHSTYYQSSLPSLSIYVNQPKGLVISKSYHYSQPVDRMTTWWKGDVGSMMEREAYKYVGDMKSISTCDYLPRSHKSFRYRYSSPCPMLFSPAWFYLHVNENN